jgi:hypothetical protein
MLESVQHRNKMKFTAILLPIPASAQSREVKGRATNSGNSNNER